MATSWEIICAPNGNEKKRKLFYEGRMARDTRSLGIASPALADREFDYLYCKGVHLMQVNGLCGAHQKRAPIPCHLLPQFHQSPHARSGVPAIRRPLLTRTIESSKRSIFDQARPSTNITQLSLHEPSIYNHGIRWLLRRLLRLR